MRVLVTGGSGFIGRTVVERLLEEGYDVLILDLREPPIPASYIRGDIRYLNTVKEAIEHADLVVHLAAVVSAVEAMDRPLDAFRTNVEGTLNVIELSKRRNIEKVIYASSVAVYGEPRYLPIDEDHPTIPKNVYGASKLAGESLLLGYNGNYGLQCVSLRLFNVYGPNMKPGPYAGVIYKFLERIRDGESLRVEGDGKQTRDFVFVEDVAEAILRALESDRVGIYNIGTGREVSILELADLLFNITGKDMGLEFVPPRPGDIRRSMANIDRAREELGWEPRTTLEEGLKRTVDWFFSEEGPK